MTPVPKNIHEILPELNWLWTETLGIPSVSVAIIDGEVKKDHPALQEANLEYYNTYTHPQSGGKTAAQHGTHIASIIFGQHDSDVKGIAPQCKGLILPVFFDDVAGGIAPCSQLDLARTITQAADAGANIINISGGELSDSGTAHPILSKAVEYCSKKNVLVVAAAGNDGCACLHIPGALPSVLVVGGMDEKGAPLDFSNWGDAYRMNGILAPGENIPGAQTTLEVVWRTGTSYATAVVSGIAALLLSIQVKRGINPDPTAIRAALLESAVGCNNWESNLCRRLLKGRIDIKGAYEALIHPYKQGSTMEKLLQNQDPPSPATTEQPLTQAEQPSQEAITAYVSPSGIHAEAAHAPAMVLSAATGGVQASDCGCGGGETCSCGAKKAARTVQMVYALGSLGYDLVSEARRDSIAQHTEGGNPNDPARFLKYLEANPWDAASVTWTLNLDATPVYAIQPYGAFAADGYKRLQDFLKDQLMSGADRISVPGYLAGQTRLMSGQIVPVVVPELRCMYNWNTAALLKSVLDPKGADKKNHDYEHQRQAIANFLERVYHELRNLGASPDDRAINYAATNALNVAGIFAEALKDNMQLDTIEVESSPICRLDSDCRDVKLVFFDPEKQFHRARKVYRFTIDVSDVCPVMVGAVRTWFVR